MKFRNRDITARGRHQFTLKAFPKAVKLCLNKFVDAYASVAGIYAIYDGETRRKMHVRAFLSARPRRESSVRESWIVGYVPRKTMNGLSEMSCSDHAAGKVLIAPWNEVKYEPVQKHLCARAQ